MPDEINLEELAKKLQSENAELKATLWAMSQERGLGGLVADLWEWLTDEPLRLVYGCAILCMLSIAAHGHFNLLMEGRRRV